MRVLAITNLYPNPYQPQRATFNRHQLRLLGGRHPVQVISPISWTDELRWRRGSGVQVPASRRVQCDGLTVDHPVYGFTPGVFRGAYGRFYLWSVWRTFWRAVREFRPTVVFAPWAYPDGWAAVELARRAELPVVVKVHGSDICLLAENPARRAGTEAAVRRADAVMAVSADLERRLVEMGVEPGRIRVIYDGVDAAVFSPGDKGAARRRVGLVADEPVVLFVGNLVPVKGVDVLLAACGELNKRGAPVRLKAIGSGPLLGALKEQARRLGIAERVDFLGSKPQTELADWYRAADLFVLPSHSEGVPNVLLEASACGTPWVASRVGGIPEIAEQGQSRMVRANDVGELVDAMRGMIVRSERGGGQTVRTREQAVDELETLLLAVEASRLKIRELAAA